MQTQISHHTEAKEHGVWSGSPLFANSFLQEYIIQSDITKIENGLFQYIVWESLFSLEWVKQNSPKSIGYKGSNSETILTYFVIVIVLLLNEIIVSKFFILISTHVNFSSLSETSQAND